MSTRTPLIVSASKTTSDKSDTSSEKSTRAKILVRANAVPTWVIIAIVIIVLFVSLVLVIINANKLPPPGPHKAALTTGGSAAQTAPNVFIDNTALTYLFETMTDLTNDCNIANTIGYDLVLGSAATTLASWQQAKAQLNGTCDFYGLVSMEFRTNALEGPLDICYAYASVGFQIVQIYYNNTLPFDFLGQLLTAYGVSYPLKMYWDRSSFTPYDVASAYLNQVNLYIAAAQAWQRSGGSTQAPSISTYQSAFCNPYFGQDNLGQYNSLFQPWLAFPFEGLIQKLADTYIPVAIQNILGGIEFTAQQEIKNVYAIGSQYIGDVNIELFNAAVLGGLNIIILTDPPQVAVPAIKQSLYSSGNVNSSAVPVFVFATYTDNVAFYSSFAAQGGSLMLFGFTDEQSQVSGVLPVNIATELQNAIGAPIMSAMDFTTTHPYEVTFGPDYVTEKFVADLITLCIGTQVNAQSTVSGDILNTFAIKNTAAFLGPNNILDIGGRLTQEQALAAFSQQGASLGLQMPAFSIQLTESTPAGGNLTAAAMIAGVSPPGPNPLKFDWRNVAPACLATVISQGQCENCWAISSSHAMSARLCIAQGAAGLSQNRFLSTHHVTTCSQLPQGQNGCQPQMPQTGFSFMTGDVHSFQCMPTIDTGTSASGCQQSCNAGSGGSLSDVNGILQGTYIKYDNPTDIKTALVNGGPLAVGISVPSDLLTTFPLYTPNPNGVYMINPSVYTIGGHMIMLVGYDDTANPPYWIVQNSWGSTQGQGGYLKLQQDPHGTLSKSGMWVDRYGWAATPRPLFQATSPTVVLTSLVTSNNGKQPTPTVYTNQLGCPNLVVNTNQSAIQASLQGCPNSAGTLNTVTKQSTTGGHTIGAASSLHPSFMLLMILLVSSMILQ